MSDSRSTIRRYTCLIATLFGVGVLALSFPSTLLAQTPGTITITGTLALSVSGGHVKAVVIEIPDADIYLREASGKVVASTVSQLDGKFYLTAPKPGAYGICWRSLAIGVGCVDKRFGLEKGSLFLGIVPATTHPGVIYGKALTGDNRPCWVNDSYFKLDVSTRVNLLNPASRKPIRKPIRANIQGEYVFGGVKAGRYVVGASCEKATNSAAVSVGKFPAIANVNLLNHAPTIDALSAFDSSKAITRASTGSTVKVIASARDRDKNKIEYLWRLLDGYGSIPGTNSNQQDWTLGSDPGRYSLYVMARDGRGGYAFRRFDLEVGAKDVSFFGRVIDETTKAPVAGATVSINGTGVKTNQQGWFNIGVPPVPSPERYVLNINDPGYALLSQAYDQSAVGNTYELIRAQTGSFDPSQVIDIVDTNSSGPCGTPGGRISDKPGQPGTLGELVGKKPTHGVDAKPCRHRGAHLILPAGALVDDKQNLAQGPVTLAFATLDPSRRALPGDYRAVDRNNAPVEMLSFGALYASFRDAGGNPINLKTNTPAEIRVPVSDLQRPSAQPTIAIWSYDEKTGLWNEEGKASLQNTAEGWMYIGKTSHFSTLNMDVAGNDPAQATCVRFSLDSTLTSWSNLVLRAYVSYAGTSLQVKETSLNSDFYHAIYRIPYAPPAQGPNTLRLELRGTYNGQTVVLLNNVINTDARPKMTGNNLWPPYDYSECGVPITLTADPVTLPYYGDIDGTGRPAFLTGPYGQFLPPNGDQVATDYYNTIDPGNATNPNLQTWWTNHNFNADGSGGTRASYLNFNDLGFGRDMNCKVNGSDLACYVTNYGAPDQNAANADDAENQNQAKRGATVAMEYKSTEPAANRVRFYVYAPGNPATAGKLKFADLDGLGPKPVPYLCVVCHGGNYDSTAKNTTQARFREFDLPSFHYSSNRIWDFGSNALNANELTSFATLNQMVRDVAPNTSPIKDLINAWYPGGFGAGTAPVKPTPPSGWSTQVNGYHNVYAKSCRTCHIARDNGTANNYYTFSDSNNFAGTSGVVCNSPKVMPNAYITYKNFWSDLQRVIDYKALTGAATCQ